jgi:hypothetical protein
MRWCLALGIVLAALIAATVTVAVRRPRAAVATHADEPDEPEASMEPAPSQLRVSAPSRREARSATARSTAAQIIGRVLQPAGEEISFDDLTVAADDGARTIEARVFPDGRFTIHLPGGQYAVAATLGNWVGLAPSVTARPDAGRELAIQLGKPAAIRGHVRGPDGVEITVRASLAGRNDWQEGAADDDGDFALEQLTPGRAYDLAFEGIGLRTTTLRSVTAPADGVAATVIALPVLRGAIGLSVSPPVKIARSAESRSTTRAPYRRAIAQKTTATTTARATHAAALCSSAAWTTPAGSSSPSPTGRPAWSWSPSVAVGISRSRSRSHRSAIPTPSASTHPAGRIRSAPSRRRPCRLLQHDRRRRRLQGH